MITEDYVSYDTAKLLKEKGFNEPCIATYNLVTKEFEVEEVYQDWTTRWAEYVSAPTLQMAMKWLREIYHLEIYPFHDAIQECNTWWYSAERHTKGCGLTEYESDSIYGKYEEACEAGIKYCLENLI